MIKPLTDLLGKDVTFHWGTAQQLAFDAARSALHSVSKLQHFRSNCPLRLTSDASNVAIACVLEQFIEGRWAPLEFWSRKLRGAELRYAAFDRELLGAFESVKKFRHLLAGVRFDLRLDHRPVVQAFSRSADCWNDRQARHLSFISEFDVNPIYLPGHLNTVADALSRAVQEPAEVN
ncbi:MAG: ribonuclease H family protein, partial [Cyanobacteria bacterium J06553_1]